jgi:signal transduction histidine kinase/CheY-like chemotaxis protein
MPHRFLRWIGVHHLLFAASVGVPALLFGLAAHDSHVRMLATGRDRVERTAGILREHAQKVFETQELAIARVADRIQGLSDQELARPETNLLLRALSDSLEHTVSMWISSADGSVLAGSMPWHPSLNISLYDFWQAQRDGAAGLSIGAPFVGRATGVWSIGLAQRRPAGDGGFQGTIHAALSPAYFARYFAAAGGEVGHRARLIRADGQVLAQSPAADGFPRLPPGDAVMRAIAAGPAAGAIDTESDIGPRVLAVRRVGAYPVFVAYGIDRATLLAGWWRDLAPYLLAAIASALALLLISLVALRESRGRQAALLALANESEQRLASERKLREASRLEAIGRITGGVAHDFNNLLTTVLVSLDLVADRPGLDAEGRRHVEGARKAAGSGARLVASLLAYARGQKLEPTAIDAGALVADMLPLIRHAVGAGVSVSASAAPGLAPCLADADQLRAALLNLALNARDAMPTGGRLAITIAETALDAEALAANPEARPGRFIVLSVEDGGAGIAAADLPRVFEPFFTTKPTGQGTGLGLSQVFGFARQSAGHVQIESEPGRGTVVRIFLPVSAAAMAAAPRAAPPAAVAGQAAPAAPRAPSATPRGRLRILVVDDNADILGLARTILAGAGHAVVTAPSGDEAARLLDAGGRFDLVISDVVMPGSLDGFALAAHVASTSPGVPVVLMSGYAPDPSRSAPAVAGFVGKPFCRDALLDAVASAVQRRAAA